MPRLLSTINSAGAVGIQSDGTSLGNATKLNFENKDIKIDVKTGVATVFTDPLTVLGL